MIQRIKESEKFPYIKHDYTPIPLIGGCAHGELILVPGENISVHMGRANNYYCSTFERDEYYFVRMIATFEEERINWVFRVGILRCDYKSEFDIYKYFDVTLSNHSLCFNFNGSSYQKPLNLSTH